MMDETHALLNSNIVSKSPSENVHGRMVSDAKKNFLGIFDIFSFFLPQDFFNCKKKKSCAKKKKSCCKNKDVSSQKIKI